LHSDFGNRHSEFRCGGIAQLVERQLCKLDVRGSNPLASKAAGRISWPLLSAQPS
jgi:hypothetical protein